MWRGVRISVLKGFINVAKRKRDHKAEYARRKAKAQQSGYGSVRAYRTVRRELSIPRNASPIPKRIRESFAQPIDPTFQLRQEARNWSRLHSRHERSRYNPSWSDERVAEYHYTYVDRMEGIPRRRKSVTRRQRIWEWLKKYFDIEEEWSQEWISELQPA